MGKKGSILCVIRTKTYNNKYNYNDNFEKEKEQINKNDFNEYLFES